jgi:hypothetical protein
MGRVQSRTALGVADAGTNGALFVFIDSNLVFSPASVEVVFQTGYNQLSSSPSTLKRTNNLLQSCQGEILDPRMSSNFRYNPATRKPGAHFTIPHLNEIYPAPGSYAPL